MGVWLTALLRALDGAGLAPAPVGVPAGFMKGVYVNSRNTVPLRYTIHHVGQSGSRTASFAVVLLIRRVLTNVCLVILSTHFAAKDRPVMQEWRE